MSWPEPNRESGHPSGPCGGSSWLAQSSYLQAYNYASTIRTKMFELMRRHIKRKGPEIHSREHLRRGQRHRQQQPFVRLQARGKGTGDGTKKKREKRKGKGRSTAREKHCIPNLQPDRAYARTETEIDWAPPPSLRYIYIYMCICVCL